MPTTRAPDRRTHPRLRYEDLSADGAGMDPHAFIDTVGCTLAGMVEDGAAHPDAVPGIADSAGPIADLCVSERAPACWTRRWSTARPRTRWTMTTCPA